MENIVLLQAAVIRRERVAKQKKRYRQHQLNRFRRELVTLDKQGYSHRDMANWLCVYKGIRVAHTTVGRALKRWRFSEVCTPAFRN